MGVIESVIIAELSERLQSLVQKSEQLESKTQATEKAIFAFEVVIKDLHKKAKAWDNYKNWLIEMESDPAFSPVCAFFLDKMNSMIEEKKIEPNL